jgi:hypothetical protein
MAETFERSLLTGVTSGTGPEDGLGVYDWYESIVEWGAGVGAGVVVFEWAPYVGYAGTWLTLATHTFALANSVSRNVFQVVGGAVRARVTTPVTGGTINVKRNLQVSGK